MNDKVKDYKIYALIDPITNEIRYVGKTVSILYKRLSSHCKDKQHTHKTSWISSLKNQNLKPIIKLIEVCNENNWEDREKYWISFYRPQLTNLLDGGQGLPRNYKHSQETIEKIRITARGKNAGHFTKDYQGDRNIAIENSKKRILQYDLEGNFIKEWKGVAATSIKVNINKNSISACLKERRWQSKGYQWKYFTENYPIKIPKYKKTKHK